VPILQLKQEISNLQVQYDDLQCDNEIKVSGIAPQEHTFYAMSGCCSSIGAVFCSNA
jgi:hypothetical protein